MTEVACEGDEIIVEELLPLLLELVLELVPLLLPLLVPLLLEVWLLVKDVGDVDVEEEDENALLAFSAALLRTILKV